MPHVATSPADLLEPSATRPTSTATGCVIDDEAAFRDTAIRDLAWTAAFSTDEATTAAAQWLVWEASQELGAQSASIQDLYAARGRGEVSGFTVPAINLRAQTFDMARTVYEAAKGADVGAVILELARSEQTYTFQRPIDYATAVAGRRDRRRLARPGLHPGRPLPVQRQEVRGRPGGDDRGDPARLPPGGRRRATATSTSTRSTLVDLSKPTADEQQRENYARAAELTALIRTLEADGVTDQRRRRDRRGRHAELDGRGAARLPRRLSAASSTRARRARRDQQGQRPDRDEPRRRAAPRRRRRRGQARLRGPARARRDRPPATASPAPSSTAPRPCPTSCSTASRRSRRPRSTSRPGFQNALYEHPAFPESLHREIEAWCYANAADERKAGQTDQQFVYTTRKKAIGPFKRQLWDLATKDEILAAQRRKIAFLFTELGVNGSREMVAAYIRPVELHRPMPDALREAVGAG